MEYRYVFILIILVIFVLIYNKYFIVENLTVSNNKGVYLNIYLPLNDYSKIISNTKMIVNNLPSSNFDSIQGVNFDGNPNEYIQISDLGNISYTVCFNIYISNLINNSLIFTQGNSLNSNDKGLCLSVQNNKLQLDIYNPETGLLFNNINGNFTLNSWNFVTIVINKIISVNKDLLTNNTKYSYNIILYINGVSYGALSQTSFWKHGFFILGYSFLQPYNFFIGNIRDFIVFDTFLDNASIKNLNTSINNPTLLHRFLNSSQIYTSFIIPDISPSVSSYITPSVNSSNTSDFASIYFNVVNNGTYNASDSFSFSDKFYNDPPDITDISKNYIGYDNLYNIVINIYNNMQQLLSEDDSCSIYQDPSIMSKYCIQYNNIYGSITNLINDLYTIWPLIPDPIQYPDDITGAVIADMINSLLTLQSTAK